MNTNLYVITISHQLGSGGTILGQKLSERLGIPFFDREILSRVAKELHVLEADIENREERVSSFWESYLRSAMLGSPTGTFEAAVYIPSDDEIFEQECETISKIAEQNSGIFLGRCGFHVLHDHPHHVRILVYADLAERVQRVRQLYKLDAEGARKMIQANDHDREAYVHAHTRQDWLNASLYDLCMNTSTLGMETAFAAALGCVERKLGVAAAQPG